MAAIDDKPQLTEQISNVECGQLSPAPSDKKGYGTVRIIQDDDICLVPTPTQDPNDPLNLTFKRKIILVLLVSAYTVVAGTLTQGFSGVLSYYKDIYTKQGVSTTAVSQLSAMPNVFMGIGNLAFVPVACAVGRRPVFLGVMLIVILGCLLAAFSTTYEVHLGARMIVGLGAGLSESLGPMMTAETFFLHERATSLVWLGGLHSCFTAAMIIATSPIAGAITPKYWYIMLAAMMGVVLVLSFFWVPETRYHRTTSAYQAAMLSRVGKLDQADPSEVVLLKDRPPLDTVNFQARTLRTDIRLFSMPAQWSEAYKVYRDMFTTILFPDVLWATLINGVAIGQMVSMSATSYSVLMGGYNWKAQYVSFVSIGQIVVSFIAVPVLGLSSDRLVRYMASHRDGMHHPETRLLTLFIPLLIGILALFLYGEAGAHPHRLSWGSVVFAVPAQYFSFTAVNIVTISYLVDSYPTLIASVVILLCAIRGFIGFGIGYTVTQFVAKAGYLGCFGTYAALYVVLGIWAVILYFTGYRIRQFCSRFISYEH